MMTPRGTQPTTDASRYFIITSPTSYENNVLYYLSIHESGFVTVPGKKRKEFRSKSTAQDVWGQIFRDEYHEEKGKETRGMSLCLGARAAYSAAKIWFISGTPWSTSPRRRVLFLLFPPPFAGMHFVIDSMIIVIIYTRLFICLVMPKTRMAH